MSEASFASLGPTLLARKGGAKPAMRPQLAPLPETVAAEQLEDLGWNDMGQDDIVTGQPRETVSARVVPIGTTDHAPTRAANEDAPSDPADSTAAAIATAGGTDEAPLIRPKAKAANALTRKTKSQRKPRAGARKGKAPAKRTAFTLRLDAERHLKLRLAATIENTSAQALLTEALDAMLTRIEGLDAIAERFHARHQPN
ncbi:hypothetical protein [Qipengyuania nanhaisediminis]|uniref:hypothetical protein n=1 Tax=Qipengyuania nanhaisediminis TaxID=604088 RepID=UPI0038B2B47C